MQKSVDLMSQFPILANAKVPIDRVYQLNSNLYGPTLNSRALVRITNDYILEKQKDQIKKNRTI